MTMLASTGRQHVAHGKHHGEPDQQNHRQKDDLRIGKITAEPVGKYLHLRGSGFFFFFFFFFPVLFVVPGEERFELIDHRRRPAALAGHARPSDEEVSLSMSLRSSM